MTARLSKIWDYLTLSKFPFILLAWHLVFIILPLLVWQETYKAIDNAKGAYYEGWFDITTYPQAVWFIYQWADPSYYSDIRHAIGWVNTPILTLLLAARYLRGK